MLVEKAMWGLDIPSPFKSPACAALVNLVAMPKTCHAMLGIMACLRWAHDYPVGKCKILTLMRCPDDVRQIAL